MSNILNIVFYKDGDKKRVRIFYNNGEIAETTYEEGLKKVKVIAEEEGVITKTAFQELVNNKKIFVMSKKELDQKARDFMPSMDRAIDEVLTEELEKIKDYTEEKKENVEDKYLNEELQNNKKGPEEIEEKSSKLKEKIAKINKKVKGKILPCAIALGLITGVPAFTGFALNTSAMAGEMTDSNIQTEQQYEDEFDSLLKEENGKTQKEVMENMKLALNSFNIDFANHHKQKITKDNESFIVKPALSWDEMISLQMAYNDYSADEIREIFNGAEIDANDMENNYKNATLQLMGAYVIEDKDCLVDISTLVHSKEGLAFVTKYQNMLEDAKNATGKDQIEKVKLFYNELYKDFPITEEIRTEGISHADSREIESYKLAVAPMVGAAEMMFQNLEIDHTLTDKAIDYFNDLGLCNLAEDTFDKIEVITLSNSKNEEYPLYNEYKEAMINSLEKYNAYVIDDKHRDLSLLDKFQERVNGHFNYLNGYFDTETYFTTVTYTTTKTWKVTKTTTKHKKVEIETSNRDKAVQYAGEDAVKEAEKKVDQQIEKENKENKEKGEQEAKDNQEEMQKEADKDKQEKEEEVKQDEKDMEQKIDDANKTIEENNKDQDTTNDEKVNEEDFGDHNVDFDDEHSNSNGDLDDSVKDITTDDSDVKTHNDLPDPNKTGKKFDSTSSSKSNEEKVNAYVERMANVIDETEDQKVLVKE